MFSVGDRLPNDTFKEGLEDATGLFIHHGRDTLDATTAGETPNSGLGDAQNLVSQDLTMTLSATLAEALPTQSPWRNALMRGTLLRWWKMGIRNLRPDMMLV